MRPLELHMACSVIQRSKGRSSVAAAAYIAGQDLKDERTGQLHSYSKRDGVVLTGIALSEQAPAWALDRQTLWSSAEIRERHPRAQTARSMTVNLPHEFSGELRREATTKIATLLADRYRGAVDWALHEPSKDGDHRNHHGHFLMTARPFENGQWAAKKDRSLDDRYGQGPVEYRALREKIAGVINDLAVREKLPVYVEHLSFEDRKLELEPTKKLGPAASAKERRGEHTERGDENRAIRARNEEREALRVQSNVINIEPARELQKQRRGTPLPRNWQAAYTDLYRESYNKRAAMNEHLERAFAEREQRARQEAARLQHSLDSANFMQRIWRRFTGQTRQELEAIEAAKAELRVIGQRKEEAVARFERDRKERFEAFHNERLLYEQRIRQELERAIAIGETRRPFPDRLSRPKPDITPDGAIPPRPAPVSLTLKPIRPTIPPPSNERTPALERREAFFKRIEEAPRSLQTAPARPASGPGSDPKPAEGIGPQSRPKTDYTARTAAFFERTRRKVKPERPFPAPAESPRRALPTEPPDIHKRLRKASTEPEKAAEKPVDAPKVSPLPTQPPAPETRPRPDYAARTADFLARTRKARPKSPEKEPITAKPPEVANDDDRAAFMKRHSQDLDGPDLAPEQSGPKL